MKLNLSASDEQLKSEIAEEDKKDSYKLIFGVLGFLVVVVGLLGYFYYSDQSQRELENQKNGNTCF